MELEKKIEMKSTEGNAKLGGYDYYDYLFRYYNFYVMQIFNVLNVFQNIILIYFGISTLPISENTN